MTTLQAPFIDPKALPSTPTHEWAEKTATDLASDPSIQDSSNDPAQTATKTAPRDPAIPHFSSTASTPGHEFPGAYPRNGDPATTTGILDTANQYIPTYHVQNVMSSAGETAKQYLPQVVTSYFAGSKQTASPDSDDKQGVSGGETSAPAATTTNNVNNNDTYFTQTTNPPGTSNSSSSTDNFSTQAQDGSATSETSSLRAPTVTPDTHPGSTTGGVGDLPGSQSESDVAVLPEERNDTLVDKDQPQSHEPVLNIAPRTHPLAGYGAKWGGVPLSEDYQRALDSDPDRQLNIGTQDYHSSSHSQAPTENGEENMNVDTQRVKESVVGADPGHTASPTALTFNTHTTSTAADSESGHSQVSRDRDLGGVPSNTSSRTAAATSPHGSKFQEMTSASAPRTRRASEGNGSGNGHKTTIMDKIKGEAKVISGKLGKNEEKVEEGRRLMGKV